jgi:hypothetical protein
MAHLELGLLNEVVVGKLNIENHIEIAPFRGVGLRHALTENSTNRL